MSSKYIKLALVQKFHWQRKFINAHREILSKVALDEYKSEGRGALVIFCGHLLEYIVPGFNIPKLYYYKDEYVRQLILNLGGDGYYLEKYINYDPEKNYYVIFARYTNVQVRIWRRESKIVDEDTWNKKFDILNLVKETNAQNQEIEIYFDPQEIHWTALQVGGGFYKSSVPGKIRFYLY